MKTGSFPHRAERKKKTPPKSLQISPWILSTFLLEYNRILWPCFSNYFTRLRKASWQINPILSWYHKIQRGTESPLKSSVLLKCVWSASETARLLTWSRKVVDKWVKKHPSISVAVAPLSFRPQQSRKQWAAKCKHELPLAATDVSTLLRYSIMWLMPSFLPIPPYVQAKSFVYGAEGSLSFFTHSLAVPNNFSVQPN